VPRTRTFIDSPELYDAIYHFKNYARECDRLRSLIDEVVPSARTILDVACGTGEHAKFLKHRYAVDGIDINESYLPTRHAGRHRALYGARGTRFVHARRDDVGVRVCRSGSAVRVRRLDRPRPLHWQARP